MRTRAAAQVLRLTQLRLVSAPPPQMQVLRRVQLRHSSTLPPQRRELPGGVLCIGQFEGDLLKQGRRIEADGTKYEGEFAGGVLKTGTVLFPDGRLYSGTFADGGLATGSLEEDGAVYNGCFDAEWRRSGQGTETLPDGSVYEGEFAGDNLVDGKVYIPKAPGGGELRFVGKLVDGSFSRGELRYNGMRYNGPLQANSPHGPGGRLELEDGSVQEGAFCEGRLHGEGHVVLRNGAVFAGQFKHGALAAGTAKWPNGDRYDGELDARLRPNGKGEMYKAQHGHWWRGDWAAGTFSGGSVTDDDGSPVDYRLSSANQGAEDLLTSFESQLEEEWEERREAMRGSDTPRADWEAAMRVDAARFRHFRAVWMEWTAAVRDGKQSKLAGSRFMLPHGFDWCSPPQPAQEFLDKVDAEPQTFDQWRAQLFVQWRLGASK